MSLSKKLSFFIMLMAVVPLATVGGISYLSGRASIEKETINHLIAANTLKKAELDTWMNDKAHLLETIALMPLPRQEACFLQPADSRVVNEAAGEAANHLRAMLSLFLRSGGFLELFLIDAQSGRVSVSTDKTREGKIKLDHPYFKNGTKRTYFQNIYYSIALQEPTMTISTPVLGMQGELKGVLAGRLDLSVLSVIMERATSRSATEDSYLVNKFNFFVTEPRFGKNFALKKSVNTEGVRLALEKKSGYAFYNDYRGVPVIGAYFWLPEREMALMTEMDQQEAFAPAVRLRNTTALFGCGIMILGLLAGLGIARSITKPLAILTKDAERIGSGDLETAITGFSGAGETGVLAGSLEKMRSDLKDSLVSRDELSQEVERRRKTLEALEIEKDFSDRVINGMPGLFFLCDERLCISHWNTNFESLTGLASAEIAEKSVMDFFAPGDRAPIMKMMEDGLKKRNAEVEADFLCADGRSIPHFFKCISINMGGVEYLIGMGIDISSRLAAEQALKLDRERLLAILDGIEDVIYVADPKTYELLHVNEAMRQNWGRDVIGKKCYKVLQGRSEPCPFCTNDLIFGEYLGKSYVWEFQNETTHGWYRCSDKAIQWVDGRMVRFEIASDISQLKRTEEDLKHINNDLERSNKELEQFAYVASHDLQEPLRMVASYTQLLVRNYGGRLDEKADKYIGYAVEGATRMQGLVNDLLALSRVGTRGKPFEDTDSGKVVATVMRGLEKAVEASGAVVEFENLPVVKADRTQLEQLFQNLIGNAIKFAGDETPRVTISAERKSSSWIFRVKDNGIGIDPKFHERVFTIFQRLHERGKYSGSGIGLAIVKKIVERHGGKIWIESSPGRGASFLFSLPVNPKARSATDEREN